MEEKEQRYKNLETKWTYKSENSIPRSKIHRNNNIKVSKPIFYRNNRDQHPVDFKTILD
jgi:hypothetical protein